MATEIIKKRNGKIVMKFHAKPVNLKKIYLAENQISSAPENFHAVIYVNRMGQIAQYSPIESDVDFSMYYHRLATPGLIKDLSGDILSAWEKRKAREAETARLHAIAESKKKTSEKKSSKKNEKKSK